MSQQTQTCPECGAELDANQQRCWLCHGDLSTAPAATPGTAAAAPASSEGWQFSIQTMMLVMLLVSLGMGIGAIYPGLGVLAAIVTFPVFIRTSMVVRQRESTGRPVDVAQRISLFLGSFVTSVVILVTVTVASIGTFCAVCLSTAITFELEAGALWIAGLAALAATIFVIRWAVRWVRRRYERDVEN